MGPFWKQILERRKTQTCRKPRKRPIRQGDRLFLYWKSRVPKDKKPIHFIGKAVCVKVERKKYGEFAFDDEFARRDGFRDASEMQEWFGDPHEYADDEYDVILFSLLGGSATGGKQLVPTYGIPDKRLSPFAQSIASREPAQKKGGGIRNGKPEPSA